MRVTATRSHCHGTVRRYIVKPVFMPVMLVVFEYMILTWSVRYLVMHFITVEETASDKRRVLLLLPVDQDNDEKVILRLTPCQLTNSSSSSYDSCLCQPY